jgi:hypothetical protein
VTRIINLVILLYFFTVSWCPIFYVEDMPIYIIIHVEILGKMSSRYKENWNYKNKGLPKKRSFGLACCRLNPKNGSLEIAMVKKRCSFWYIEFVLGHYKMHKENLLYLFNRMTNEEKLEISNMDFAHIWYRVWMGADKDKKILYNHCKQKFEQNFPDSFYIKMLISQTKSYDSLWEIPKGKKDSPQESDINCAIREAEDELGIGSDRYTLIDCEPKMMIYSNMKVQYINKYFVALADTYEGVNALFPSDQREIIDARWMTLEHIKIFDQTGKLSPFIKAIFIELRKKYKISKKFEYQVTH